MSKHFPNKVSFEEMALLEKGDTIQDGEIRLVVVGPVWDIEINGQLAKRQVEVQPPFGGVVILNVTKDTKEKK